MRYLFLISILFVANAAQAADITITVPDAAVPRLQQLCSEIRTQFRVRSDTWTNADCAEYFVRLGASEVERRVTRRSFNASVNTAVGDALASFQTDFPEPFVRSSCGDSTIDTEFGEACDDGNTVDGDGCSDSCKIE